MENKMNFYYIADRRNANKIQKGHRRNKFYQSKSAVKSQLTSMKLALARSIQMTTDEEWAIERQEKLDNLVIMVVSGIPKELED